MHRSAGLRAAAVFVCWLGLLARPADARTPAAPSFGHAAIVQRDGEPTLVLDGRPIFFWGAAFFYERIPPAAWRTSMLELRELGVTTLDLYVPWNWHEVADAQFDFDGHTNPRRNLREVLRLGRELGFTFIVRPGPVVRNEWRNGGYPAWLLTRPEYGMPLHDVLEGRYPATATLQNARSDDAAAEWMRNATHLRYASRWLHRVLSEFRPVADCVLAVQLDDDQGAYLDNQTYPAPHLQRYLRWLDAQVRDVVGPVTPTFINTYEMRVPSSSPVWTMGNWYQSDAYAIGEHDRSTLDASTAMLRTSRRGPLAISEFQAGWLAQPEDPQPRPADPSNTTLALYDLLGWGVHGVVDFPMQDTLAPFGWEAPFSNALYAWDAALRYPWVTMLPPSSSIAPVLASPRYAPTFDFGRVVHTFGPLLARTHRVADVAIAYAGSAHPGSVGSSLAVFDSFRDAVQTCRRRGTTCEAVDLRAATVAQLLRYRTLVLADTAARRASAALLAAYTATGGRLTTTVPAEHVDGTLLRGRDGSFFVATNWSDADEYHTARDVRIGTVRVHLPPFVVAPRSARIVVLDARLALIDPRYEPRLRASTTCQVYRDAGGFVAAASLVACDVGIRGRGGALVAARIAAGQKLRIRFDGTLDSGLRCCVQPAGGFMAIPPPVPLSPQTVVALRGMRDPRAGPAQTYRADAFADGGDAVVLQNAWARAIIVPAGGGRVPVFSLFLHPASIEIGDAINVFDATGALRDDVLVQPPPSATDRIARYTHSYPAGTFNRRYEVTDARDGSVTLRADLPDGVPSGARFERVVSLASDSARLVVDERVAFGDGPGCADQRGVVLSALTLDTDENGVPRRELYAGGALVALKPVATTMPLTAPGGIELVERDGARRLVLAVSWRPDDVESASWTPQRSNGTLRLVLAPGWRRVTYAMTRIETTAEATAFVEAERAWVAANPAPISEDGEVAKRYTQSPQKRPSESSCGFESHLPQ